MHVSFDLVSPILTSKVPMTDVPQIAMVAHECQPRVLFGAICLTLRQVA